MVYLENWTPPTEESELDTWNPPEDLQERVKEMNVQAEEQATLAMSPAVADVKASADAANKWLDMMVDLDHSGGTTYTEPLVSDLKNVKRTAVASYEVATAMPYALTTGAGRVVDNLGRRLGMDIEEGEGLEGAISRGIENYVPGGEWLKEQSEKSPTATKFAKTAETIAADAWLVGKGIGVGAWGLGKLAPLLMNSKYAQYIPNLQNIAKSDFVRGMMNPKTLSENVTHGTLAMYGGRWAAAFGENALVDYVSAPEWWPKEGDQKFLDKAGLLGMNIATNAGLSIFATLPLAAKIGRNNLKAEYAATRGGREVFAEATEAGLQPGVPIANKQWNFRNDFGIEEIARKMHNPSYAAMAKNEPEKYRKIEPFIKDKTLLQPREYVSMLNKLRDELNDWLGYKSKTMFDFNKTSFDDMAKQFLSDGRSITALSIDKVDELKKLENNKAIELVRNENGILTDIKLVGNSEETGVTIFKPIRKGNDAPLLEDIRVLKRRQSKGSIMALEDAVARKIGLQKAKLSNEVASNVFMRELKDDLQFLDGGLPPEMQDFLTNYLGHAKEGNIRSRSILQSVERAVAGSAEGKAILSFGRRTAGGVRKMESLVQAMTKTWHEVIESGNKAVADQFFDLYSVIRNKGYAVSKFADTDSGLKAVLDMGDLHTYNMFKAQTGLTDDAIAGLLSGEMSLQDFSRSTRKRFAGLIEEVENTAGDGTVLQFYAPSMANPGTAATITDATAQKLMREWATVQEGLYDMLNHSEHIYDLGKSYKKYHVQTANESADDLWFVFGRKSRTDDDSSNIILGTYRNKADALKDMQHWENQKYEVVLQPERGKDAISLDYTKSGENIPWRDKLIAGYHEGRASGRWQGNLYDTGVESLTEVYQGLLEESRFAVRQNARAATSKIMDALEMTGRTDLLEDYRKMLTGQAPRAKILSGLDEWLEKVIDNVQRPFRQRYAKVEEVADNIWRAAPIELRSKGRNFVSSLAKDVSLAMYSGGNLSAAVTNVLSIMQSTPMAMQWFNKFPNETAEEWLLRTGIKLADNAEPVMVSDTMLGLSFMKKMTNAEERAKIWKMAEESGVLTNEMKELQFALDPLRLTPRSDTLGMFKKGVRSVESLLEKTSGPVFATEAWSRLAAYGVGLEVATKRFKMTEDMAKKWAAGFVDVAMGSYDLFGRPGYSNSLLLKHFFMFTTYMNNIVTRNLDMFQGGAKSALLRSNLMSAILFGPNTTPFVKQWLTAHDQFDDVSLCYGADMGLSAYTGLAFNSMVDFDVTSMTRGVTRPLLASAIIDLAKMTWDIGRDMIMSGGVSGRAVAESISTHFPAVAPRRAAQALLGYKVTMNRNLLTEAHDIIEGNLWHTARLLSGLATSEERMYGNYKRFTERQEEAKQIGTQQAKRSLLTRLRDKNISRDEVNNIMGEMLQLYGYDADALSSNFLRTLQDANADVGKRIIFELMQNEKYNPITNTILNSLSRGRDEGFGK